MSCAASYDASTSSASVPFIAAFLLMLNVFGQDSQMSRQKVTCVPSFMRVEKRCVSSRTEISPDFVLLAVKTMTSVDSELMSSRMVINLIAAYVNLSSPHSLSSSSAFCVGGGGDGERKGGRRGGGRRRGRGKLISFTFLPSQSSAGQEAREFLLIGIRCVLAGTSDSVSVSSSVKTSRCCALTRLVKSR